MAYVAHYGHQRHMHNRRFGKAKPQFVLANGALLIHAPVERPAQTAGTQMSLSGVARRSKVYRMVDDGVARAAPWSPAGGLLSWPTRFSRRPWSRRYSVLKFNRDRDIPGVARLTVKDRPTSSAGSNLEKDVEKKFSEESVNELGEAIVFVMRKEARPKRELVFFW
jgi:hypothetical protein